MAIWKNIGIAAILFSGLIGGFVPMTANAGPIGLDQWYAFRWDGEAPAQADSCEGSCTLLPGSIDAPSPSPWLIDGDVTLFITDAFSPGDSFSIFNNNSLIGATPLIAQSSGSCATVDACFADDGWSSGSFELGSGKHALTFSTNPGSFSSGAAYFRVEATTSNEVPLPATIAFFVLGLLGFRRRQK